jgi:hypothetical protein
VRMIVDAHERLCYGERIVRMIVDAREGLCYGVDMIATDSAPVM